MVLSIKAMMILQDLKVSMNPPTLIKFSIRYVTHAIQRFLLKFLICVCAVRVLYASPKFSNCCSARLGQ